MSSSIKRIKTTYKENVLAPEQANDLYTQLKETIPWYDGVRSKNGFTRKAFSIDPCLLPIQYPDIYEAILKASYELGLDKGSGVAIGDVYLNYYRNGEDYTPAHSHPKSKQLVISLGTPRTTQML
jgi:hypothetical protein